MRQWKNNLLIAALVVACAAPFCIGQDGDFQLITPPIQRVGSRLACLCGVCKNTVGDCAMLACEYCAPTRAKIAKWQTEGKSDDQIVAMVVKERGLQALSSPPSSGFSLLAWWMPVAALGLGLIVVTMVIRRFLRKPASSSTSLDPALLNAYHDRIEKDLAKLD
ncbi:MAG TPA: cytochrome c-type biogenesis protein CcmH [Bryobacteraceae bacterium]|nr:cytochrome c-type biogenesis protein CcmH [Bryobacteraceae bacterium]